LQGLSVATQQREEFLLLLLLLLAPLPWSSLGLLV
jgi:hypothetical protein